MFRLFRRRQAQPERRSAAVDGFTGLAMDARASMIAGPGEELSSTVTVCASLWANGLAMAETDAPLLSPAVLAHIGRSLALHGNSVWIIDDGRLVPVAQYEIVTRRGQPRAYRCEIPDTGGATSVTALAGEVLHVAVGAGPNTPWAGVPPLRQARITPELLHATERALADVYEAAPLGSKIAGMPEQSQGANQKLAASFRGKRGRVLLRDSTAVMAAGGTAPAEDWRPADLSPQIRDSMILESLADARNTILHTFGVLPALANPQSAGPVIREAERHLANWTLGPIAKMIVREYTDKLGDPVTVDVAGGVYAFDVGGRARALSAIVRALAEAQALGVDPSQVATAANVVGLENLADDVS